jgi:hypothetical protein
MQSPVNILALRMAEKISLLISGVIQTHKARNSRNKGKTTKNNNKYYLRKEGINFVDT